MKLQRGPLLCWDIYATHLANQSKIFEKKTDVNVLNTFKEEFNWSLNVEDLIADNTYNALVLTNYSQEICWVNKGFTRMTGYPASYAKGKRPKFLQGEATSVQATQKIKSHLKLGLNVKETLINYKKNGLPYKCTIEIFPIRDMHLQVTHMLALEKVTS